MRVKGTLFPYSWESDCASQGLVAPFFFLFFCTITYNNDLKRLINKEIVPKYGFNNAWTVHSAADFLSHHVAAVHPRTMHVTV